MLTRSHIFRPKQGPPVIPPVRLVLPNGQIVSGTPAELTALVDTIRQEVRAQVRPGSPISPIMYALPAQRPLRGSPQSWLRLASWIEGAVHPRPPSGPSVRARFPGTARSAQAGTGGAAGRQTAHLVSTTLGQRPTQSLRTDPSVEIDPADPRSPLTSVPQQYLVRVLVPDARYTDGWGPHPQHFEEIEVWAGSLATASLFIVFDAQYQIQVVPGQIVAARWAWHVFETPNTARPWTHAYTCFLDTTQIAMIQAELDRQTELLI